MLLSFVNTLSGINEGGIGSFFGLLSIGHLFASTKDGWVVFDAVITTTQTQESGLFFSIRLVAG
jgi:hypothetical protein